MIFLQIFYNIVYHFCRKKQKLYDSITFFFLCNLLYFCAVWSESYPKFALSTSKPPGNNSPLIRDYHNQIAIQQKELQRLKAFYTRSRVELNGDYLFVPIIVREDGKTSFKWNAKDATDYYGYDLGESSGSLHAGINWTQPLLGNKIYKTAKEQAQVNTDILNDNIRMEKHQLERSVKEQYILTD